MISVDVNFAECVDVYKYFNTSCYSGLNDGEKVRIIGLRVFATYATFFLPLELDIVCSTTDKIQIVILKLCIFQGFYTVFRKVFEDIVAEDTEYVDDPDEFEVPGFGTSKDSYEETNVSVKTKVIELTCTLFLIET